MVGTFFFLEIPEGEGLWWHGAYMFFHANVWHLCGNMLALWLLHKPLHLVEGLFIGFFCSWLPSVGVGMTVGFSGVLFGIVGVKWGLWCRGQLVAYKKMAMRMGPLLLLGVLLPGVNWCLHLYCFLAGLICGLKPKCATLNEK